MTTGVSDAFTFPATNGTQTTSSMSVVGLALEQALSRAGLTKVSGPADWTAAGNGEHVVYRLTDALTPAYIRFTTFQWLISSTACGFTTAASFVGGFSPTLSGPTLYGSNSVASDPSSYYLACTYPGGVVVARVRPGYVLTPVMLERSRTSGTPNDKHICFAGVSGSHNAAAVMESSILHNTWIPGTSQWGSRSSLHGTYAHSGGIVVTSPVTWFEGGQRQQAHGLVAAPNTIPIGSTFSVNMLGGQKTYLMTGSTVAGQNTNNWAAMRWE